MSSNHTESAKTSSYEGNVLRALAASVRAAPLRPVTCADFHAVKQADWVSLKEEQTRLTAALPQYNPLKVASVAVRLAGIKDLSERQEKISAHKCVSRALTILRRGSK